jgi:hypothetical protein
MDYKTKLAVTSSLLGVLVVTAVLGLVFNQQAVNQRLAEEPLLRGYDATAVTGLELTGGVVLKKEPSWALSVTGKAYPASAERIDNYLKSLATLQRERLVTSGDGQPFGLGSGFKTLKLLGTGGKVLADLQVGGPNDQGNKVYVRFAGEKDIWQTDRGFARPLDLDFNTWADLSLFPGRKGADLTRIAFDGHIQTADKTVYAAFDLDKSVKDGKTKWENRTTKASTETMASWAELVPSLHFGAFASPTDPPAGAPVGTVTLNWADGSSSTIKIAAPDTQNRYRVTDGTRDFWLNDWALGQLLYR